MVVLSKIYTRTGDSGSTALGNGERVAKDSARVSAYGTVDEANSAVGIARLHAPAEIDQSLARIQNDLFDLGADLCRPEMASDGEAADQALRVTSAQTARLEEEIDQMNSCLSPLRSFVLPGGTPLAAHLHACRTLARRAERQMVALASFEKVNPCALTYVNRLSDWFFVASRKANQNGEMDVLWVPGANRQA